MVYDEWHRNIPAKPAPGSIPAPCFPVFPRGNGELINPAEPLRRFPAPASPWKRGSFKPRRALKEIPAPDGTRGEAFRGKVACGVDSGVRGNVESESLICSSRPAKACPRLDSRPRFFAPGPLTLISPAPQHSRISPRKRESHKPRRVLKEIPVFTGMR